LSRNARVISPKLLTRYMERHRLLDETSGTPPERFLVTLVNRAMEFVPSETCALLLDDPVSKEDDRSRNELTIIVLAGEGKDGVVSRKVRPVDGIAGFVYARGERTCVNEVGGAYAFSRETDGLLARNILNVLAVPVVIENHVCGSLILLNRQGEPAFTPRDERLMELFGDTLSLALQNLLDERRAREVARRDSLTSLYNDRYFHRKLQREIDRLAEAKEGNLALLFLDCDHLKRVNDLHGHLAGSQVLREVSFILQRTLADTVSLACRYGGDEFTVILLEATRKKAMEIAEAVRKAINDWVFLPMSIGPGEPALNLKNVISMSIGVATWQENVNPALSAPEQKNELLKLADAALYMAKTRGKNCVVGAGDDEPGEDSLAVILKT
jgi:diguanylate cyclase (GGDEF)-like protein